MANEVDESNIEEVRNSLSKFQHRFAQLPDVEEPPQTFLQLLGQESEETDWNTILSYFLDPSEPHGFGTDFLEAFLSLLEENPALKFDFDRLDFGELEINSEWVMRGSNVRPDITIYSGRHWFVIVEMKVDASEHDDQTLEYVRSKQIGNIDKSEFTEEEGGTRNENYVYLAPESAASAEAPEFVAISWSEVVEALEQFEYRSHGRYPTKSHAQLNDYLDTIQRELNMTDEDFEENQKEKLRLYAQYADEIDDARGAFEEWHEGIEDGEWKERFLCDFRPPSWGDGWRADPSSRGHIYRKEWRLTKDLMPTTDKGDAEYRIDFTHKPRNKEIIKEGRLPFEIYCAGMVPSEFKAEFERQFGNNERISSFLESRGVNHKGKMFVTEKDIYTFEPKNLPESYYKTLRTAFEDYEEIADDITEVFESTLDDIKSE